MAVRGCPSGGRARSSGSPGHQRQQPPAPADEGRLVARMLELVRLHRGSYRRIRALLVARGGG